MAISISIVFISAIIVAMIVFANMEVAMEKEKAADTAAMQSSAPSASSTFHSAIPATLARRSSTSTPATVRGRVLAFARPPKVRRTIDPADVHVGDKVTYQRRHGIGTMDATVVMIKHRRGILLAVMRNVAGGRLTRPAAELMPTAAGN